MSSNQTARVLEIQRMSTEDGPGIRTTVFFKGCSLRCRWCHNPESISLRPQVHWIDSRCIGCRTCVDTCPEKALTFSAEGIAIDRTICTGCGVCADECPSTAMELLGKSWSLEDLVNEVVKDKAYFEKSQGGITVSGGEPGMQAPFVAAFLKALREKGVHTALDTCGLCTQEALQQMLSYASMVLFDIKEINPEKHIQFTGASNEQILQNLLLTADYLRNHIYPAALWIRTPIIPGMTAREKNISQIGKFIADNLGDVAGRWELCAFNNLCRDKYLRLGQKWELQEEALLTRESMEQFVSIAKASGVRPDLPVWTGSTRLEKQELPATN